MTYQVYGNGGKEYKSDSAINIAEIAHHYNKIGVEPKLWKVGIPDIDGPVQIVEVKIQSSIKKNAAALSSAKFD